MGIMTKEIKLTLTMILSDKKVPEKMKAKAIEQLEVYLMQFEEADAEYVVGTMLMDAIEAEDKDALDDLEDLVNMGSKDQVDEEVIEKLTLLTINASKKFFDNAGSEDRSIRLAALIQLVKEDIIPLYYDDSSNIMLFYSRKDEMILAATINDENANGRSVLEKFSLIDDNDKAEIFKALHDAVGTSVTRVIPCLLAYHKYADKQAMLSLHEL